MSNRWKRLEKEYDEAMELQNTIQSKKKPRKKYQSSNHFLRTHLSFTFPLTGLSRKEAIDNAFKQSITGKEGFFALVSNKNFSLHEALNFYREKDSVEKLINSIKNEIHLRPTRVWTPEEIDGSILIAFLAQLVISMLRFKHKSLRRCFYKIYHAKPEKFRTYHHYRKKWNEKTNIIQFRLDKYPYFLSKRPRMKDFTNNHQSENKVYLYQVRNNS